MNSPVTFLWKALRFLLFVVCPLGCVSAFAESELRIATYNVRNYLVMDRQVSNRWRPSYPKPEREKSVIRRNIREQDPDILVLQEMGPVEFLKELRADLAQEGLEYAYSLHMEGADPDRHLAILSKISPHSVMKHTDLDFKYLDRRERVKRGMLEASFKSENGASITIFAVHLKSRYTEDDGDPDSVVRRTREAEACRNRIIERTRAAGQDRFMILGDFNDHPRSAALRRFYKRGKLEIASLLPASDSRGEVWTYYYEKYGQYSRVDAVLVSSKLLSDVKGGRAHIVDTQRSLEGSDHRMLYVDLVGVDDRFPEAVDGNSSVVD